MDKFLNRGSAAAAPSPPPRPSPQLAVSERLALRDAEVHLYSEVFTPEECTYIEAGLQKLEDWERRKIVVYGKPCYQNRESCQFSKDGSSYRYSGIEAAGKEYPDVITYVENILNERCDVGDRLDFVLCNRYRFEKGPTPKDDVVHGIGFHSDDEGDLVPGKPIVSITVGKVAPVMPEFVFRRKGNHEETLSVKLPRGSVLIMGLGSQTYWEHGIPARKYHYPYGLDGPRGDRFLGTRFNLTFRAIMTDAEKEELERSKRSKRRRVVRRPAVDDVAPSSL